MVQKRKKHKTTIGEISAEALVYTAGEDIRLDLHLVNADCIGSAAHAAMLAEMPVRYRVFTSKEKNSIIKELVDIMRWARKGTFRIRLGDQDIHLAIERILTERMGDAGRKIHTARSRNDQVAVDLRLYGKEQLLGVLDEVLTLGSVLLCMAQKNVSLPMVGRTHMQPAMPSSVGLWASAYAESLADDAFLLRSAYELNNQCPLGAAAGYGIPFPIDRQKVSDLLGFQRPLHNVLYAINARGKVESVILSALSNVMITISRLAQDMMIYSMPEFNYFTLPEEMCTGSSIMPQKNNPDVLELVRAKTSRVIACSLSVMEMMRALPGGYNRDIQEAKEPFLKGFELARSSLCILVPFIKGVKMNRKALLAGFRPAVFATDYVMEHVAKGMTFRQAYSHVKRRVHELEPMDPCDAIARKKHMGAAAALDFGLMSSHIADQREFLQKEKKRYYRAISRLLHVAYPL